MIKQWMKYSALMLLVPTALFPYTLTVNTGNATADATLQDEINKQFQVPNMGDFLKSMSNAQSLTNKGQGVSYATEQSLFVVGGSGGLGYSGPLSSGISTSGGLPGVGLGIQVSGMLGISLSKFPLPSLGPVDLKRFTVFVNYFSISNDSLVSSLTLKANTFGFHLQYKLMDGKNLGGIGILNWGGVLLTTGLDSSSNSMTYKVGQTISVNSGGVNYDWKTDSTSALQLQANTFTIPIEVSTSVRILYILSLFAGVGLDLNFSSSNISANLSGPVSVNGTAVGSAALSINETHGPTFGQLRFFGGPQINIVPLKNTNVISLYAQGNVSTGGSYGLNAGARIAW